MMEMMFDWMRGWRLRFRTLLRPDDAWNALDEELRFHVEMEIDRLIREGCSPDKACREAMIRFGGIERFKEKTREARGTKLGEDAMQDLKYGLRMLTKNPVFSAVAIITLALGIGANTAIYTVVEAVLLEPLPFDQPDELTLLWTRNDAEDQDKYMVSPMDFDDWRTLNSTFESMAAFWPTTGTVTEVDDNPTRVRMVYTTEDFFDVIGATPLLGRTFSPDDGPGSTQVVVLSHGFWQRRFGGDPDIVGQTVTVDGGPNEVIGILRPEHTFPADADMWLNITWGMQIQSRIARWMSAVGRLSDQDGLEAARADLAAIAAGIAEENPGTNEGWTVTMEKLHDEMVGDTRAALLILLGATGFILLIACANVANLLLSRSEVRAKEIAVRVAFGAGRGRLVRQLATESLVLAGAGALLGLAAAQVGVKALVALAPVTLPRGDAIALDGTVLGVVAGVSLLTGVLFGLAPIVRLLRSDLQSTMRDGSRSTSSVGKQRVQNTFVVGQFALALMLVVGAGLLVRSFQELRSVDGGFVSSGVLTLELDVARSIADTDQAVIDFYEQFEQRVAELPGVTAVGDASTLPLAEALDYNLPFTFVDWDAPSSVELRVFRRPVSPGFLRAMRTPMVAGRDFNSMDRSGAPGVVLINEAMARKFFPSEDPIGKRVGDLRTQYGPLGGIHQAGAIEESEIVGVVKDMKYDGLRGETVPALYVSGLQSSIRRRTIAVLSTSSSATLLTGMRRELAEMSPGMAVTNVQTMDEVMSNAQSRDRFSAMLLTLFGVVALLLASVGVYGVLAYAVEQRTSELGIRMALGADRGVVRAMVLTDGLRLVLIGLAVGIVGAISLSGLMASQLFGVDPRDPTIYVVVAAALLAVGLVASFVPAWKATRVSPVVAMRCD